MEMRCYQPLLNMSYKYHITNAMVCNKIQSAIGPYKVILSTVKKGNYDGSDIWLDQVAYVKRSYKAQCQGKEEGKI